MMMVRSPRLGLPQVFKNCVHGHVQTMDAFQKKKQWMLTSMILIYVQNSFTDHVWSIPCDCKEAPNFPCKQESIFGRIRYHLQELGIVYGVCSA